MVKRKMVQVYSGDSAQSAEGTTHSLTDSERIAFVEWINSSFEEDDELKSLGLLPVNPNSSEDLFDKIKNGILLW